MTKILDLTAGTPTAGDVYPVARSGSNVKLTLGSFPTSGTSAAPTIVWGTSTNGWFRAGADAAWGFGGGGGSTLYLAVNHIGTNSSAFIGWASGADATATKDTSLSRVSAGLLGVGTGASGEVDGSLRAATYATSAPVTETGTTHTVATTTTHLITNQAAAVTVTLPAAASFPGRQLWIRAITNGTVVSNASNVVPQVGGAAGTAIIGAVDGGWALLVSDGTSWEIMASSAV